jgi:hypothetical protein
MLEKRQPLQQMVLGKLDICMQKMEMRFLSPCNNISLKWFKDINARNETLKLPKERLGKTLEHISIGNNFLNRNNSNSSAVKKKD